MTQDKMELLAELWKANIRAEADYSNDYEQNPNSMPKARFLVTLKKVMKKASGNTATKMIKVHDNELKVQREETRETLIEYIKSRLKMSATTSM
jgi:maltodextrin utilization protein YvdJ